MASATPTDPVPPAPRNGMRSMVCIRLPTAAAGSAPPEGITYTLGCLYKLIFVDRPGVPEPSDNLVDTTEPFSTAVPLSARWSNNVQQCRASFIILAAKENSIYNHLRGIWMPGESVADLSIIRDTNAWLELLMKLFMAQHYAVEEILEQMWWISKKIKNDLDGSGHGKRVNSKQLTMASIRVKMALSDQQTYMYGPIHDFCWQALQPGDRETRVGDLQHGLGQAELASMMVHFNHRARAYSKIMKAVDHMASMVDLEVVQSIESEEELGEANAQE